MKVKIETHTSGEGLWNSSSRAVLIIEVYLNYYDKTDGKEYGELCARFRRKDWPARARENNEYLPQLIYTDPLWLKEFRAGLVLLGFTAKAVKAIGYSEQGMQGDNYVSLDAGPSFFKDPKVRQELLPDVAPTS